MGHYGNLIEAKIQAGGDYFTEPIGWKTVPMDKHTLLKLVVESLKKREQDLKDQRKSLEETNVALSLMTS
jgi:hypothetical protein